MILQRANFNVPARFSFQPFAASWRFVSAELVEWGEEPKLRMAFQQDEGRHEKASLRVRIEVPDPDGDGVGLGGLSFVYGCGLSRSYPVLMERASIPPKVLPAHENCHNTPDISGRSFLVLICQKPEFKDSPWALKPEDAIKNAWLMSDEFLNLEDDPEEDDPELSWVLSVWRFLNKWGIWESGRGFSEDWSALPMSFMSSFASLPEQKIDKPDFVLVIPHLLKEQQGKFRRAVLPSNARPWLRSHPVSLDTADEFPFFRVRRHYCRDAIEATITIDHLGEIKHGICKRCHRVFEKEKNYKMSYCGRSCANAASVARFREKQRKPEWTAAKIAKLLSQKRGKGDAKG